MQKDPFGHLELKEAYTPSEKLINSISKSLSEKGLIAKYSLTIKDLERASEILPFCTEEKTETAILAFLALKPKFELMLILKVCIEAGLISLLQRIKKGMITTYYSTTVAGRGSDLRV